MDPRLEALNLAAGLSLTPAHIDRLAKKVGLEMARWALEQTDLRRRAKAKFSLAEEMIFTRDALEQATSEPVAEFHAARFPAGEMVSDLTAGIGADTIALAGRGPTTAYELEASRIKCTQWNLGVYGRSATLVTGDCFEAEPWGKYVFADPGRRLDGKRLVAGEKFAPDPQAVVEAATEVRLGLLKLSPMQSEDELLSYGPRLEFVSHRRECKEALVSFGPEAIRGIGASSVETGEWVPRDEGCIPVADSPGEYLYDADAALVRAHAVRSVSSSLEQMGDSPGYLTGSEWESSWLRRYRVVGYVRPDRKDVQAALRKADGFVMEVKQRGAGADADKLRNSFQAEGARALSLIVIATGKRRMYVLAEAA